MAHSGIGSAVAELAPNRIYIRFKSEFDLTLVRPDRSTMPSDTFLGASPVRDLVDKNVLAGDGWVQRESHRVGCREIEGGPHIGGLLAEMLGWFEHLVFSRTPTFRVQSV